MVIDRQDRTRSAVDRDGAGGGEVDLLAQFIEGRATASPPVFGRLFAASTGGFCRGQFRRTQSEDLAGGVDGDGADTGGAEVESDDE